VKGELEGFKTVVREGVRLAVNTSVRIDLSLEVGGVQETVTVTGETPLLQTDRTDTGRTIESIQVASMPLSFNRNFQGMMATVPGASRPYKPHSEFFNSQDSLSSEVNGQSRLANNVQIEGLDNNQRTGLLTVLIPPAEAIDTVSVTTSNYDAEFGRAGGAVTLKSGRTSFGKRFPVRQHGIRTVAGALLRHEDEGTDDLQQFGFTTADRSENRCSTRRLPADRTSSASCTFHRADGGVPPGDSSAAPTNSTPGNRRRGRQQPPSS
jgi:hypothetical protein